MSLEPDPTHPSAEPGPGRPKRPPRHRILRRGVDRAAPTRALRESEERLRFALAAGRLGFWRHDLATDHLICSDLCKAHFGRAPAEPVTHDEILSIVHPEDRERVQAAIREAVQGRRPYDLEYRVVWSDGTLHWLMVRGHAYYDAGGRPVRTFGLTLDITARKEAEAQQALVEVSLREASRRKDEFLAMLAHELRNPLSPILAAVQILRMRGPDTPSLNRYRDTIDRNARHLARLVDDLLEVSRLNEGKITLRLARTDLAGVVEQSVAGVQLLFEQRRLDLTVSLPPHPVHVRADATRLVQVLTNLLNNAAKYTDPGGAVWLSVECAADKTMESPVDPSVPLSLHPSIAPSSSANTEPFPSTPVPLSLHPSIALSSGSEAPSYWVIRVRDTGRGITPELITRVFDLFVQGERTLDRSEGGLGIGLTLVKRLVEMHGGRIEAHSPGPGQGSEFTLWLPTEPNSSP